MSTYQIHGLKEKLTLGKFVVTVELEPPKGANPMPVLEKAAFLKGYVDGVNIADSPMATLRMSPIALAHVIQQDMGIEAIFHLTCRDRNVIGLQSELLGAAALGVRNILTLTGDQPTRGDHPDARGVYEVDSIGLAKIAKQLNEGLDLTGHPLNGPTQFFIGAAANPGADDLDVELEKLKRKVDAGVHFVQTQPVFDLNQVERYLELTRDLPIHIIFGILPLKNGKMAHYLNQKVPGIQISEEIISKVEQGGREAGIEVGKQLIEKIKGIVQGIHIYPIGDLTMVSELLDIPQKMPKVI
ncbi:methylenetetrahydrofolate reductase [Tepidibacillus fermentans]|uniref:Methylenetetrahydrofolate reductase n=1 Tax=Tepidibacillus fermentans TaxID=1281767 RepID=A0A4R3KFE4_9BACI|nr:methylenetetrahydrofolate reductase [Tepidibacillus fermentans]TCS82106.1 5,10-methylenetetrahydrofolate reductase [Tepidibacillus fermentans]